MVEYGFTLTNTGNVTVTDATITDPLEGLSEISYGEWPGETGALEPGETVSATATYTLTQADVDAGGVDKTAPAIALDKTGALPQGAATTAGDPIVYMSTVINAGNITLAGVTVTDDLAGLSEIVYGEWPGVEGTLAPGESVTATASYQLTQADVDAGGVDNRATATGVPPAGQPPVAEDGHQQPLRPLIAIDLAKTRQLAEGAEGTLAPGRPVTASYPLTSADLMGGTVTNQATASGVPPTGEPPVAGDTHVQPVPGAPCLALVKDGALEDGAKGTRGDAVEYTFTVTNSGSTALAGLSITDQLEGVSEIRYGQWPGAEGELAPGESVTATASYQLTEADVAAGHVDNSATATGTPPKGPGWPLARTGVEVAGLVALAASLLIGGAAAVRCARRRGRDQG